MGDVYDSAISDTDVVYVLDVEAFYDADGDGVGGRFIGTRGAVSHALGRVGRPRFVTDRWCGDGRVRTPDGRGPRADPASTGPRAVTGRSTGSA